MTFSAQLTATIQLNPAGTPAEARPHHTFNLLLAAANNTSGPSDRILAALATVPAFGELGASSVPSMLFLQNTGVNPLKLNQVRSGASSAVPSTVTIAPGGIFFFFNTNAGSGTSGDFATTDARLWTLTSTLGTQYVVAYAWS